MVKLLTFIFIQVCKSPLQKATHKSDLSCSATVYCLLTHKVGFPVNAETTCGDIANSRKLTAQLHELAIMLSSHQRRPC